MSTGGGAGKEQNPCASIAWLHRGAVSIPGSILPGRVTKIYLTRLGNQADTGTNDTAHHNSRRTANYANSGTYTRT